jgi:hypothetical protein
MRKSNKSREAILQQLASEPIANDPKKRDRVEVLAKLLWSRSLSGDKDALRMLLDRLPKSTLPEPTAPAPANPSERLADDPYKTSAALIRQFIETGLLPPEAFDCFLTPEQREQSKIPQ